MLYSYVVGPKKDTIMNSTDLAVRRIDHESGDSSFDVVARMPDDAGNVYIRSIGSLSENAIKVAYGFANPMAFRCMLGLIRWHFVPLRLVNTIFALRAERSCRLWLLSPAEITISKSIASN